ncbi:MAG: PTS sugar transporter subunit IIA [Brevinematales bacterium]|jgi:mannitol/fructose-specific phosphotransferase system IIA component (Ntr-type)
MKSLLNALQEGRLVELPVNDKDKALEYLAILIEAIPDIGSGQDLVGDVRKREAGFNSGIGMGIACPHVRTAQKGELLCAVGWSPQGIDYGSTDGKKVHLMIMYYIPDSEKNEYLKEVSGLAKAVSTSPGIDMFSSMTEVSDIRNMLLDWVELAIDKAVPDAKARMIKLEEKSAIASKAVSAAELKKNRLDIYPFSVIIFESNKSMILSGNPEIVDVFETSADALKLLEESADFEYRNYRVSVLSRVNYLKNRIMLSCIGVKLNPA